MTTFHNDSGVTAVLLQLARADVPATALRVARELGATPDEVRAALARLDGAGLVDSARCRLTLLGLVAAASAAQGRPALRRADLSRAA